MFFLNKLKKFSIRQRIKTLIFINILSFVALGITSLTFIFWFESKSLKLEALVDLTRETQVTFKKQIQEWKNILLRGETDFEKYNTNFRKEGDKVEQNLEKLKIGLKQFPSLESKLDSLLKEKKQVSEKYYSALNFYDPKTPFISIKTLDAKVKGIDRKFTDDLDGFVKEIKIFAKTENSRAIAINQITTFSILIIGIFYCVLISFFILKSLEKPIDESNQIIREISRGNLSHRAKIFGSDEINDLLSSINSMVEKIANLLRILQLNIRDNNNLAVELSDFANEYQKISESVNLSVGNELDSLNSLIQITNKTDTLSKTILTNTTDIDMNLETILETQRTFSSSLNSLIKVNSLSFEGIQNGKNTVQTLKILISNAKEAFKKISSVTYLIQNISKQTNLLALNASIEAARAGDVGLGFAVVAENISRLADESLSKVKEINLSVQATDEAISKAVDSSIKVEDLFSSLMKHSSHTDSTAKEFINTMNLQNNLITEISKELKEFQQISVLLDSGLKEERASILEVRKEIDSISIKSLETSEKSIQIKDKITSLRNSISQINESMEFFSIDN